jgi:predicted kinase
MLIGCQGSGKSTFYQRHFADTHIRINLDMLRTRNRERLLFEACLQGQQPMVIDNTNPTPEDRARYIQQAKDAGFQVIGYYLRSRIEDCRRRNMDRPADRIVPLAGLLNTYARLVCPTSQEGFDELYYVWINDSSEFVVKEWADEVR